MRQLVTSASLGSTLFVDLFFQYRLNFYFQLWSCPVSKMEETTSGTQGWQALPSDVWYLKYWQSFNTSSETAERGVQSESTLFVSLQEQT